MDGIDVSRSAGMDRNAEDDTDQALANAIASGESQAWGHFFDLHADWAYRFSYTHLHGNRADAEDLCSDIMMTAACSIKRFDHRRGTLDQWLLGLARHRLSRFCRQRKRELPFVPTPDAEHKNPEVPVVGSPTEASDQRDLVNRALASLPLRQGQVLIGKYASGYSVEEIAGQMETTAKAIESLLSRARAGFRSAFKHLLERDSRGESNV